MMYRRVKAFMVIGSRLIVTLEPCLHQYTYKRTALKNYRWDYDRQGRRIMRCLACEEAKPKPPEGGPAA